MSTLDDDDKDLYEGPQYVCDRACFGKFFLWVIVPLAVLIAIISLFI